MTSPPSELAREQAAAPRAPRGPRSDRSDRAGAVARVATVRPRRAPVVSDAAGSGRVEATAPAAEAAELPPATEG